MKRVIDVSFPRILTLRNVTHVTFDPRDPTDIRRRAQHLVGRIRQGGERPVGPLVQRSTVVDDQPAHELLRQASGPVLDADAVVSLAEVRVERCLLARFEGAAVDLPVVFSKLAVTAYEEGLELSGTFYTVILDEIDATVRADVFAEAT